MAALSSLIEFTSDERAYLLEGMQAREATLSPYATRNADEVRQRYVNYPRYADDPGAYVMRAPFMMEVE